MILVVFSRLLFDIFCVRQNKISLVASILHCATVATCQGSLQRLRFTSNRFPSPISEQELKVNRSKVPAHRKNKCMPLKGSHTLCESKETGLPGQPQSVILGSKHFVVFCCCFDSPSGIGHGDGEWLDYLDVQGGEDLSVRHRALAMSCEHHSWAGGEEFPGECQR